MDCNSKLSNCNQCSLCKIMFQTFRVFFLIFCIFLLLGIAINIRIPVQDSFGNMVLDIFSKYFAGRRDGI